jgi:hypothetical protein
MFNFWVLILVGIPLVMIEIFIAIISLIVGRSQFTEKEVALGSDQADSQ